MAEDNKRIHFIPPLPPKREKRVGIYCRVSTNSTEQLKSLTAQVSALTRLTAANPKWLLVDVYIDIASSKTGSSRKEFSRMLQDCKSRDIEIILTKSISRFGRDTVEILDALNKLKVLGVRVIFEQEQLDTADTDSGLMISIVESFAQAVLLSIIIPQKGESFFPTLKKIKKHYPTEKKLFQESSLQQASPI